MIFPYWPILSVSPETGEPQVIVRPMLKVHVYGSRQDGEYFGLVDTGADNTILPSSFATKLGIETSPCEGPAPTAYGGANIPVRFGDVEFEVSDSEDSYRWVGRVLVYEIAGDGEELIVFGYQGFLEEFLASFDSETETLELIPNEFVIG